MRHLKLFSFILVLSILGSLPAFATDVVVTLDNIGAGLGSTANTTTETTDITATGTTDSYTLNYYQCKKQGNAIFLTKSVSPYISNKTAMPGNIKSVEVFINSGASGKTTYDCAFSTKEVKSATSGVGAVNITGGNSNIFSNLKQDGSINVEGKYFCITLGNANNGQVLKLVITCDGSGGDTPAPTLSSLSISGDLTTKAYEIGEDLDYAGLTVTGTYSDSSTEDVTSDVTWSFSPDLAVGTTSYTVTASIGSISANKTITGVSVTPALPKSTLIFTAKCNGSGTADDGAIWAVTSDAAESTFDNTKGIHYGTGSAKVSYLRIETDDIAGTIAKVVVNTSGASGTSAIVSVAVDGTAFEIYGDKTSASIVSNAYDYTFTGSASGTILVAITQTSDKKAIYCKSIIVYYTAAPQKESAGLAYETSDYLVKLGDAFAKPTLTNPHSLAITYQSDNTDVVDVATNGDVTIKAVGKALITASSEETDTYKAGSASYTVYVVAHEGTAEDPYTVADAHVVIDKVGETGIADKYTTGIVSKIVTAFNPTYGNITYDISTDGTTESAQLRAYRGFNKDGAWFTSEDDVLVGDEVVVKGLLKKYNTTYEFDAGNELVSLNRNKATAGLAYAVTAIEKNIGDAAFINPLTNPNNLTVTYSSSDENVATVNANGEVTVKGIGATAIKASFAGNASYLAQEVSFTLSVDDPSLTKVTFDATIDKTTENTELSLTKNGLTIAITSGDGRFNNSTDYRIYKNAVFTISCASGNIKRIDFTCTSSNPITGFADATGLDKEKNIWTGDATSIELTASNKQVQIPKLVVYYEVDTRSEAGLEYADTDVEKHVGDEAFINTLTNPNSVAVTYESSDTDVAEVANDGTVTIKAEGTATITASFAGDATYKPASVSYELTIEEAGLDKVTFDATIDYTADESTLTLSKGGFTLTFTGGAMNNKANYRLYKNQTMTLSSADYLIKKIEFTCTNDKPISGFADATGLDKANNQWTGETNKVELTASNEQVRIEKLVVHYVEDTRAASGLEWSTDAIVMMEGETFTPANLINPNNIAASEITIESDNTDLATVSEGVVSLVENVIGNATITAKFAGNATYKPAEFSYTITVNDPTPLIITDPASSLNFGSTPQDVAVEDKNIEVTLQNVAAATVTITGDGAAAFSASPMTLTASGTIVVSANPANIGTFNATLTISDNTGAAKDKEISLSLKVLDPADVETPVSTASRWVVAEAADIKDGLEMLITGVKSEGTYAMGSQANNNRTAVEASISEGVLTPGEGTMSFILEAQGEGKYALRTSNGKYLYAASSSSNYLKTEDELDDKGNGLWTITYENNEWSIVAQGDHTRNIMRFNESSIIFSCYSSGQKAIKLYKKAPVAPEVVDVTGSEAVSNIPEGSDVTVEDGGELTVDTKNTFAKLIVKEGGKVTLSNKQLTVTGAFTIETSMGSGKSGELRGVSGSNFAVTGEAYIDITLGDNGNADKWHAFTVPFPVDALNGIFDLNGNKLVNETNYAIMDYHGDIRAQGKYGWKKFRGTLVPGTFYLMTVDGARTTYRMKMKAGSTIVAGNSKAVYKYAPSGEGQSTDAGWNGIGNPTLAYGKVAAAVQVFDPVNYVYVTKDPNSCNFIVGTPFFYQAAADGSIEMQSANASAYYAPIRKAVKTTEQIKVSLANENYTDNLFISASEDATNNYQVGKDLVKMTMTNTPIVPQIFGVAYKTQLSMVHAPLVGDRATYTLNLYAPADGEYTISAQQTEDAIVYLTYEGSPVWNITAGEYNCDLQKGNNSGFGLMLVRRAPQVTTDIEGATQSQYGVRKLLINGQLLIEKDGKLFNVTGERL